MPSADCPSCDEQVIIRGEPKLGQYVSCPHCGEPLEVVTILPLELNFAPEDYEEYEDEDEDEDY